MISSNRSAHYDRQPFGYQNYNQESRAKVEEYTLNSGVLQIEHKEFALALKENVRGQFLRIVEYNSDLVSSIMIPSSGLEDFYAVVLQMVEADKEFPPPLTAKNPGC